MASYSVDAINLGYRRTCVKGIIPVDYGANQGIEWIILTNAEIWQFYRIHFQKPIEKSLIYEVDLTQASPRDQNMIEWFGTLAREAFTQQSMTALFQQQQAISRFSLAAALLGENILRALRRELKLVAPRMRVEEEQLRVILENEVLKREVVDSEEAKRARTAFVKAARQATRANSVKVRASDASEGTDTTPNEVSELTPISQPSSEKSA